MSEHQDLHGHETPESIGEDRTASTGQAHNTEPQDHQHQLTDRAGQANPAPNPSKAEDLTSSRGLIQHALAAHTWTWHGTTLIGIDRTDGTRRPLRGTRAGRRGTIAEWLINARITAGDGVPPSAATMTTVLGGIEAVAGPQAEIEEVPDLGDDLSDGEQTFRPGFPRLCVDSPGKQLRALRRAMTDRTIPNLYLRGGAITWVKTDEDGQATMSPVGATELRSYITEWIDTWTNRGDEPTAVLPDNDVCAAIIAAHDHDGLPALESVATTPVLRPDGTLLQTPGHDPDTGLYYHPRHSHLDYIADVPSPEQVKRARHFLFNQILADFPWEARSDRAQFIALMATPIIRTMVPGATPLGAITARDQGSGKSLLLEILSSMYGHSDMQWVSSEEEQRKAITAQLTEAAEPVVGIDNVPNGQAIGSHVLATLFTKDVWRDRVLGATKTVTVPNDKLWVVTGNNLQVTDDQASRTIWVRIDPKMPNPSSRAGFIVEREVTGGEYLGDWLRTNGWRLLSAMLTLVQDWAMHDFPQIDTRHRGYTRWASHLAGFLAHHGIDGFLEDIHEQMASTDETAETLTPFYEAWWNTFGPREVLARELLEANAMAETYPVGDDGTRITAKKLAALLKKFEGRYFGGLVARKTNGDTRRGIRKWKLEPSEDFHQH